MALVKSQPDSNSAPSGGARPESNASGDGVGMVGYSIVAFPSQKPAQANSDVGITADFSFTQVNEGTSLPSYEEQADTVSAVSGS